MTKGSRASTLDAAVAAFLAHRRLLGRRDYNAQGVLGQVQRFVAARGADDLTAELFAGWCCTQRALSPNTRRGRQLLVHQLCRFRRRAEPAAFLPDPTSFVRRRPYRRAVLVTRKQIARLLHSTSRLRDAPSSPLRPAVMRFGLVLLYSAGLRRGEVVRLRLADVDPSTGVLHIRESKFHKSRWVPLSKDATRELRRYLRARHRWQVGPDAPLLCNRRRGYGYVGWHGYSGEGLAANLQELFTRARVHDAEGRRPRVHDLRHSFAIEALRREYRAGLDVQTFLPKLALYMGHVSIVSTAYYLKFVPDIARSANERFRHHFGHLIAANPS